MVSKISLKNNELRISDMDAVRYLLEIRATSRERGARISELPQQLRESILRLGERGIVIVEGDIAYINIDYLGRDYIGEIVRMYRRRVVVRIILTALLIGIGGFIILSILRLPLMVGLMVALLSVVVFLFLVVREYRLFLFWRKK